MSDTRVLRFTVPGRAVPYKRVGAGGHVPAPERRWRRTVADYAFQARLRDHGWGWTDADAFELELTFHRVPAVGKRKGGDIDNLGKSVADSLNGVLFADDRQVRRLVVEIVDAAPGRERVEVVLVRRARVDQAGRPGQAGLGFRHKSSGARDVGSVDGLRADAKEASTP